MTADDVTVAAALMRVLSHTKLDVLVGDDGHLTLVPRGDQQVAVDSSGVLTGALADAENGEPIPDASIAILGTDRIGFTDAHGRFLFPGLPAKSTTVRANQLGYAPLDTALVVFAGPAITTVTVRLRRIPEPLPPVEVQAGTSPPAALPASARGYRLAQGPLLDARTGILQAQYRRGEGRIDVSLTPYDAPRALRTTDDTVQIVHDDIVVMYDSVIRIADNNDARVERYTDHEDDVHINGHTYRGWMSLWTWKSRDDRLDGCDAAFLKGIPTGTECYQQSYATPHGLLRVCARLGPVEGGAVVEFAAFASAIVSAIGSQP
jgi:hypothetical protein